MPKAKALPLDATTVAQLKADPTNRRKHTDRNLTMIADALRTVGAARSIVIDEDDQVLAGNGVTQAAQSVGMTKLRIIDTDGDEIIAVRRRGLTAGQKRAIAIYDNRTAELSEWNAEQLATDAAAGLALLPFFTDEELQPFLPAEEEPAPADFRKISVEVEHTCPKCGYEWSGKG